MLHSNPDRSHRQLGESSCVSEKKTCKTKLQSEQMNPSDRSRLETDMLFLPSHVSVSSVSV